MCIIALHWLNAGSHSIVIDVDKGLQLGLLKYNKAFLEEAPPVYG